MDFSKVYIRFFFRPEKKRRNYTTTCPFRMYISDFVSPWLERKSQTTQLHGFFECASRSGRKNQNLTTNYIPIFSVYPNFFSEGKTKLQNYMTFLKFTLNLSNILKINRNSKTFSIKPVFLPLVLE